ncbi:biopolymer transport protein ExbD [Fodinibius salinus]|uniref:Biopolymer transport protein ExbD n=1 Tax=Fodinibius salinus TaxID=860790 RepID=A0A5D3YQJ1_9BACT|nr:biopolymer transporter ExbD [Fodinibius salinus]TYP95578.1 biopolymer transport protein ExbD [Fodinibius salinus]
MGHFEKKSAKTKEDIPMAAMPDIIFMLLIFFMVTTVLREVTLQVKVDYTQAQNIEKIEQKRLVSYIYVGPQKLSGTKLGATKIQIDDSIIEDVAAVRNIMYDKLKEQPKLIVSLRVHDEAEFGIVTDIQEELREAGALRINYSTKQEQS